MLIFRSKWRKQKLDKTGLDVDLVQFFNNVCTRVVTSRVCGRGNVFVMSVRLSRSDQVSCGGKVHHWGLWALTSYV